MTAIPAGARTLVPLGQALDDLARGLNPVAPVTIPLAEAAGLLLAAALHAPASLPREAVALRAGLALAAADTYGASAYSPMLLPRLPVPVAAGRALPAGTDAVAAAEAVTILRGRAEIAEPLAPGAWTRRAGEDLAQGTILREAGRRMRPSDIAVARAAGLATCRVRRPRLGLVGTPGAANGLDLVADLARARGSAVAWFDGGPAPMLAAGAYDVAVMPDGEDGAPAGSGIVADALALRPGEDGRLVRVGPLPVLLLPPGLDAALALALTIVLPLLDRLAGAVPEEAPAPGPLTRKIVSSIGLTEIVLLRRSGPGLDPIAVGEFSLAAIAAADLWLAVPPGHEGYPAGYPVAAAPL